MPTQPPPNIRSDRSADRATVAAGFVVGLVSGLRPRGIDPAGLLRAVGVPPTLLSDRQARVPLVQYAALYNAVVQALDDEGFGLFSAPLRAGTFEFLCRGMVGSGTLAEALERAARFLRLVLPDLQVRLRRERRHAVIEISERRRLQIRDDDPRRVFAFEWLLRLLHGLACWLAGRALALDEVRFPFPAPPHAADYALVYTEHSSFGGASLLARLDAALLELPVRRDESELAAFLEGAPGKIAMLYRRDRDLVRAVREALARSLSSGPTLADTARAMGLSTRTLHRRLHQEGASFRGVRDALRREIALARLEKTERSVADIAAELGYSEPSAFFRAFMGWTGVAPTAYRKRRAA